MVGMVFSGNVNSVVERLTALSKTHENATVWELTKNVNGLTQEQRKRYVKLSVACAKQFDDEEPELDEDDVYPRRGFNGEPYYPSREAEPKFGEEDKPF